VLGQVVIIEYCLALTGIVMFFYVALQTWTWLNGMIVRRQAAFSSTRWAAGIPPRAGAPVPFKRKLLHLVGPAPQDPLTTTDPYTNTDAFCGRGDQYFDEIPIRVGAALGNDDGATQGFAGRGRSRLADVQAISDLIAQLEQQIAQAKDEIDWRERRIEEIRWELANNPNLTPEEVMALQQEQNRLQDELDNYWYPELTRLENEIVVARQRLESVKGEAAENIDAADRRFGAITQLHYPQGVEACEAELALERQRVYQ
jgi:hypothetical protein